MTYEISKNEKGRWLCFEVMDGQRRQLTLTRYSASDAASALAEILKQKEEEDDREPKHRCGCICADCVGADMTARND